MTSIRFFLTRVAGESVSAFAKRAELELSDAGALAEDCERVPVASGYWIYRGGVKLGYVARH